MLINFPGWMMGERHRLKGFVSGLQAKRGCKWSSDRRGDSPDEWGVGSLGLSVLSPP